MTTATINGKRVQMSIEEKARMLQVIDIQEENVLAVRSGSNYRTAYAVQHNGKQAVFCPCKSYVPCSHKVAVNLHLATQERTRYNNYCLSIGA